MARVSSHLFRLEHSMNVTFMFHLLAAVEVPLAMVSVPASPLPPPPASKYTEKMSVKSTLLP